jgi:hypothetical protein
VDGGSSYRLLPFGRCCLFPTTWQRWRLTRPRWPLSPRSLWSQCGMSARVRVGTLGGTWSLLVSPRGCGREIASCCLGAWLRQRERSWQALVSSLACLSQYNWASVVWAYTAGVFSLSTNRCLEVPEVLWPRQKGFNALLAIIKLNNWPLVTERILLNRFMIHCFLCGYGYSRILPNTDLESNREKHWKTNSDISIQYPY